MATIKQIAELAGVSRRTVDRVINNRGAVKPETAETINRIIRELDYQPNEAGKALAARKRKLKIGFCSTTGKKAPVYSEIRKGALEKAEDLKKFGVQVDFYTFDRDLPLSEKELEQISQSFDCDALAVAPGNTPGVVKLIQKAQSMQIPVLFFNVDDPSYERCCYVGSDYKKAGRLAAGLAALLCNDCGRVVIFTNQASNPFSYEERVIGFQQEIKERYPDIQIAGSYLLKDDMPDYYDTVNEAFRNHPDMNIIYLVNPGDYSVCNAISKAMGTGKVRIITNDLVDPMKPMLKNGLVSATISQDSKNQGRLSLDILFNKLALGKEPEKDIYYTDLNIYIAQNLSSES